MFSGIVETTGKIDSLKALGSGRRLAVDCAGLDLDQLSLGESVAVNGACLTVVAWQGAVLQFDLSAETLERTTLGQAQPGDAVNLERALRVGDRIGGHFVTGHVDGIGQVSQIVRDGEWLRMQVSAPASLARYLVSKGSITVDGVSLTVNATQAAEFELMLVPHTLERTTLGSRSQGDAVNLEVDLLARYLEGLQSKEGAAASSAGV